MSYFFHFLLVFLLYEGCELKIKLSKYLMTLANILLIKFCTPNNPRAPGERFSIFSMTA